MKTKQKRKKIEIVSELQITELNSWGEAARADSDHRFDARNEGLGMFFKRQLEHVYTRLFEVKQRKLNAFDLFPLDTEVGIGAKSYTMQSMEPVGEAGWINDYANIDSTADAVAFEVEKKIRDMGIKFGYSYRDILSAQMAGRPLSIIKASAAKKGTMKKHNRAFFDDLFTSAVTRYFMPVDLRTLGAEAIAQHFIKMCKLPEYLTDEGDMLDTLCLPKDEHELMTMRIPDLDKTVGDWIKAQTNITTIKYVRELDKSYNKIATYAYAYDSQAGEEGIKGVAPKVYQPMPVQTDELYYKVVTWASNGGLKIPYPFKCVLAELIR